MVRRRLVYGYALVGDGTPGNMALPKRMAVTHARLKASGTGKNVQLWRREVEPRNGTWEGVCIYYRHVDPTIPGYAGFSVRRVKCGR